MSGTISPWLVRVALAALVPVGMSVAGDAAPDVAVSRIGLTSTGDGADNFIYWGAADGVRAFTLPSTACNVGDLPAQWEAGGGGNHPVIGQNLFRLLDGRFEQVGQSWVPHEFCAVNEPSCGTCQPTNCGTLGVGCATSNFGSLNSGQLGGPKSQINPQGQGSGGTHDNERWSSPSGPDAIRGRLQVSDQDILAGGQFFAEVQYVTHDEPPALRSNNASWREVAVTLTSLAGVEPGVQSVHFMEPAILAWTNHDPAADVVAAEVPGGGRFYVGSAVTDNGDGTWRYEYAIQNLDSARAAWRLQIPVGNDVAVTAAAFHDVDYHSGEPFDGTDWTVDHAGGVLTWTTAPYVEDPNANALRWGTLYNFRFVADAPPTPSAAVLGLFTPGTPDALQVVIPAPGAAVLPCPWDLLSDGSVDVADLITLIGAWGPNPGHSADFDGDDQVGASDLVLLITNWGPCRKPQPLQD